VGIVKIVIVIPTNKKESGFLETGSIEHIGRVYKKIEKSYKEDSC
jgi:hypothetical protein|tara:strand:- start:221 stop:355 length:135 start_codon:yes stop_codon:yes gene_type:complete